MHQIVNELSFACGYADKYSAISGMRMLLNCINQLKTIGFSGSVCMTEDLRNRLLATDYSVNDWLYDRTVKENIDVSILFLKIMTNSPSANKLLSEYDTEAALYEFSFDGQKSIGSGLSYFLKCPIVSTNSESAFCHDHIEIKKTKITQEDTLECTLRLLSIYDSEQIDRIQQDLFNLLNLHCKSGLDILHRSVFPNLVFCDNARNQIRQLSGKEQYFPIIVRHLSVLNKTMSQYQEGQFDPMGVVHSTESESTMNERVEQRTFDCPDHRSRVFTWHTKIKSFNKRIFYYPDCEDRIVYIAHVGDKLPTTRYRT
jgi:hypothetical protein